LYPGVNRLFEKHGIAAQARGLGARFGIYFGVAGEPKNYRDVVVHQRQRMLTFLRAAIEHGVYFHDYGGGPCHHGFCAAMTAADVREALGRLDDALAKHGPDLRGEARARA
jgi:glutamate-1-semialdehyde 2,1-aminomutase